MDSAEFDGMYQVLLSFKQCDSDNGCSRYYMLFLGKNLFISTNYEAYFMTKRFNRVMCASVSGSCTYSTEFDYHVYLR